MADSLRKEVENALHDLQQTEEERAKIFLQYKELEGIIHNRLKSRLADKSEQPPTSKKSETSVTKSRSSQSSIGSSTPELRQRVLKRIEKCRESMSNIEKLSEKHIEEKGKFLKDLERQVAERQNLENKAVVKLQLQLPDRNPAVQRKK